MGEKQNARRVLSLILPVVKGDNLLLKLRGKKLKNTITVVERALIK